MSNPYDDQTSPPVKEATTKDDRLFAMLAHLLSIFTGFIGPLVIWLIKKDDSPFVDDQAKESLNFQITVFIASIVCGVLIFVGIGILLIPVIAIGNLVLCIIAGIKSYEGTAYRYPVALRLI